MNEAVSQSSSLPLLALLVSMAAVPAILLCSQRPNLREFWTLAAAVAKFGLVLALIPAVRRGESPGIQVLELAPGISLVLAADALGLLFALVASGLWIVTSIYSIGYMRDAGEKRQTRYYASFALSLSSTVGVAFAGNLLTFLVFYELLTLATYPLVIHKESPAAIRAGRMYLAYALTAGLLFMAGTAWVYGQTGSIEFQAGGSIPSGAFSGNQIKILFALFLLGVGVKSAIMPLHSWLPAAMVAPTPVSALLHAVAVVKSGVFGVLRLTGFVFGPETMAAFGLNAVLALFAGVTVITASLIAMRQDNLKARLAYSTVGHLSYIVLGAALFSPAALMGSLLHLSAHAVMKITLFFCAGAIYVRTHKTEISQLDGLGWTMPWTFCAFTVASLGLAGVPPLNGFVSKWWLCLGTVETGHGLALGVFLVSGLLNAGYLFPIVLRGFFRPAPPDIPHAQGRRPEGTWWMVLPLGLTSAMVLLFGLFPNFPLPLFELAGQVVDSVLVGSSRLSLSP
jgi:multicomponent Na+:H+ antiporter subunit D